MSVKISMEKTVVNIDEDGENAREAWERMKMWIEKRDKVKETRPETDMKWSEMKCIWF